MDKIKKYLKFLKLELHPDKSEIHALRNGITFLGYRIFYHFKLLRKRNINYFHKRLKEKLELYRCGEIDDKKLKGFLDGWNGYSQFANTHNFNKKVENLITVHCCVKWTYKISRINPINSINRINQLLKN